MSKLSGNKPIANTCGIGAAIMASTAMSPQVLDEGSALVRYPALRP